MIEVAQRPKRYWKLRWWAWILIAILAAFSASSILISLVPIVDELPQGATSPLEYVRSEAVAMHLAVIVFVAAISAAFRVSAHTGVRYKDGLDFLGKLLSLVAALLALFSAFISLAN